MSVSLCQCLLEHTHTHDLFSPVTANGRSLLGDLTLGSLTPPIQMNVAPPSEETTTNISSVGTRSNGTMAIVGEGQGGRDDPPPPTHTHTHTCMHTYSLTHTHVYAHTHTHTHTHTHVYQPHTHPNTRTPTYSLMRTHVYRQRDRQRDAHTHTDSLLTLV